MKSHTDRLVLKSSLKGALAALCIAFVAQACQPVENTPSGTGGKTGSGTGGAATSTGGASTGTGTGGASTSTGGAGTGTGGASTSTGGASTGTGTGGAATSTGGASTGTGTGGASTGTGGAGTGTGGSTGTAPLCTTEAKGGACTMSGVACGKTCGPDKKGIKLETCNGTTYDEGECTFAAGDYACYKISTTTAACPADTMASSACTAGTCMPCMGYKDSGGAAKTGYCVCGSNMKWVCGSDKEWPCLPAGGPKNPGGTGC